jgi:hypothetical protein
MSTPPAKILVTGPVGAGKTTLVRALSATPVVTTDEASSVDIGKATTTVAFDYGRCEVAGRRVHLFGTPGQMRFGFMWEALSPGAHGLVLLVPADRSADASAARHILGVVRATCPVPLVVGLTRTDLAGADPLTPADAARALDVPTDAVHPLDARDPEAGRHLLRDVLARAAAP